MMKRPKWCVGTLAIAVCFLFPSQLLGQEKLPTGKELFERAAKAMGDPQDLKKIQSIEFQGNLKMGPPNESLNGPYTILRLPGGKGRSTVSLGGVENRVYSNSTHAWTNTSGRIDKIPNGWLTFSWLNHMLFVPLEHEKLFDQCKTVGEVKFDGLLCYEVECSKDSKLIATYYFSKETGLEAGFDFELGEPDATQYFRKYKKVDGILIPHQIETEHVAQKQIVDFDKVTINVQIDEKQFETPEQIK